MKKMYFVILPLLALMVSGCIHNSPSMEFLEGEPFMVGDANCVSHSLVYLDPNSKRRCISCYNDHGQTTGVRYAMSPAEVQNYQFQQQLELQQQQALNNQLYQMQKINQNQQMNNNLQMLNNQLMLHNMMRMF